MEKLCCQHCGVEKEFKFFHSWKKDIKCQACYSQEYKAKYPDKVKTAKKKWKKNNKDKVLSSNKRSYQLHRNERIASILKYKRRKSKTIQKPSIENFPEYLNFEKNELEEIMSKIILRKCDKCGDMLAMRHFAGKSTTCRRCVDPVQYAVFLEKQKEKNERFYRNNPEKTRKQYYEDSKNNIEQNQKFDSEHFYMLFSRDNFEFNYWAKSNGIDLSFLPSLGDGQFLELIEKKDIEEQERKKELLKKYRSEKANDIKKYQREWYNDKKNKNEINNHIPDVNNMVSSS